MDLVIGLRDGLAVDERLGIISERVPFGLNVADRRRHMHLIGQTGTGKSTLLKGLLTQDIEQGRGCMLLDPHGDMAEELLDYIPPWRTHEVIYFEPADLAYPIGINLLDVVPEDDRPLVASNVVAICRHQWADSWGPRLEYVLYQALRALLDFAPVAGGISLLGVPRMLSDEAFRSRVVQAVKDPQVRAFWEDEFTGWSRQFQAEAVSPIQNKIGQLLSAPAARNVLGQAHSSVRIADVMNEGKIFIANLSKGLIGETLANLLGSVLLTSVQLAAVQRAAMPEDLRRDFICYADEAHNFGATDTFETIWSEARKYRLSMVTSSQYLDQASPEMQAALFGNVGTLVSFRVGQSDAEVLARELAPHSAAVLGELERGEVCVRLTVDGQSSRAFVGRTYAEAGEFYGRRATVIAQSRRRWGRRREVVEERIVRWLQPPSL
jgi:hypothetical protein